MTDFSPCHSSSWCHSVSTGVLSATPGKGTPPSDMVTKLVHKIPLIPQQTEPALPKKPQAGRREATEAERQPHPVSICLEAASRS